MARLGELAASSDSDDLDVSNAVCQTCGQGAKREKLIHCTKCYSLYHATCAAHKDRWHRFVCGPCRAEKQRSVAPRKRELAKRLNSGVLTPGAGSFTVFGSGAPAQQLVKAPQEARTRAAELRELVRQQKEAGSGQLDATSPPSAAPAPPGTPGPITLLHLDSSLHRALSSTSGTAAGLHNYNSPGSSVGSPGSTRLQRARTKTEQVLSKLQPKEDQLIKLVRKSMFRRGLDAGPLGPGSVSPLDSLRPSTYSDSTDVTAPSVASAVDALVEALVDLAEDSEAEESAVRSAVEELASYAGTSTPARSATEASGEGREGEAGGRVPDTRHSEAVAAKGGAQLRVPDAPEAEATVGDVIGAGTSGRDALGLSLGPGEPSLTMTDASVASAWRTRGQSTYLRPPRTISRKKSFSLGALAGPNTEQWREDFQTKLTERIFGFSQAFSTEPSSTGRPRTSTGAERRTLQRNSSLRLAAQQAPQGMLTPHASLAGSSLSNRLPEMDVRPGALPPRLSPLGMGRAASQLKLHPLRSSAPEAPLTTPTGARQTVSRESPLRISQGPDAALVDRSFWEPALQTRTELDSEEGSLSESEHPRAFRQPRSPGADVGAGLVRTRKPPKRELTSNGLVISPELAERLSRPESAGDGGLRPRASWRGSGALGVGAQGPHERWSGRGRPSSGGGGSGGRPSSGRLASGRTSADDAGHEGVRPSLPSVPEAPAEHSGGDLGVERSERSRAREGATVDVLREELESLLARGEEHCALWELSSTSNLPPGYQLHHPVWRARMAEMGESERSKSRQQRRQGRSKPWATALPALRGKRGVPAATGADAVAVAQPSGAPTSGRLPALTGRGAGGAHAGARLAKTAHAGPLESSARAQVRSSPGRSSPGRLRSSAEQAAAELVVSMGRATWGAPGNRDCAHFFPDGYAADEAQARHHVEVRSHMHVVRQLRARSRTILFRAEDGRGPVALTPRPSEGPGSGEGGKGGEDGAVGAVGPAAPARHKGGEETTGPSRPYTPDSAVLSQPSLPFEEALRVLQQAQEAAAASLGPSLGSSLRTARLGFLGA